MLTAFTRDPELGNLYLPALARAISRPGRATTRPNLREVGIFVAKQHRDGELIWASVTHNERVDAGAAIQANRVFGTPGTVANGVFTALAVANTGFTVKTKTDLGIGQATGGATVTNEFTTLGLARAAGTVSTYTLPGTLGGTFSQLITKQFTATGAATAHGAALFDSLTPTGSSIYVEDIFASDGVLATNDILTCQITISN